VLEVTPDWAFIAFALATPSVFQNIHGTLDAAGQATGSIVIPFHPSLLGISLHWAGITATVSLTPTEVSNRITTTFQ
jgi:uncharacterized membrane protein